MVIWRLVTKTVYLAVKHMASSLAVEWAKKGVRVNALRYNCVATPVCYC